MVSFGDSMRDNESLCCETTNPCVARQRILVLRDNESLCCETTNPCVARRRILVLHTSQSLCYERTTPGVAGGQFLIFMIFGRIDLRISVSGAKFDAESDFEVRLAVAPQKPGRNSKKLMFRPKIVVFCFFF